MHQTDVCKVLVSPPPGQEAAIAYISLCISPYEVALKISREPMNTWACPQGACITFGGMCGNNLRAKLCA